MKEMTISTCLNLPIYKMDVDERRRLRRKDFSCYMQVIDHDTQKLVGHLADISSEGFKLDSLSPILSNRDFRFRLDLTCIEADKPFMIFVARSRWCQVDRFDPFCYNVGFQLVNISPGDTEIFNRMIEKYGSHHENRFLYLRRSNIW